MSDVTKRSLPLGILLVAFGGLFLLSNLDLLPFSATRIFFNWKGILLLVGSIIVFSDDNRRPGFILIGVGLTFIAFDIIEDLFDYDIFRFSTLWPLALLIAGIVILSRQGRLGQWGERFANHTYNSPEANDPDALFSRAIMGGGDMFINSQNFKGGSITAIMGGGTYDLTNAQLADGRAVIDVSIIMGGVNLIVPKDWKITLETNNILAEFTDNRKYVPSEVDLIDAPELVVRGSVILGGGEIKNFV
ncbi:MAG: LiaF domain-containing protein [Bacteroidota bacterium]